MNKHQEIAKVFKALCDERRVSVLQRLQSGEKCACDLIEYLKIPQSALSYHMKILCESGIVESWSVGKWTHYKISESGAVNAKVLLAEITSVMEESSCCCDKEDC